MNRLTNKDFTQASMTRDEFAEKLQSFRTQGSNAYESGLSMAPGDNLEFCKSITSSLPLVFHDRAFKAYIDGWQDGNFASLKALYPVIA